MVLTATAPPQLILDLKKSLCLSDNCKVIKKNPNRSNIFLDREKRLSNNHGYDSYSAILKPIAEDLLNQGTNYPITIIYMKLKYCGFAYSLFNKTLQEKQYDGSEKTPSSRLFAQFHSPQTRKMKQEIITELKKEHSRIRVIFATTALGMGVDAPYVSNVIHIGPSSNLECYFQEIGRAGRSGHPAKATIYFNNSDIAANKCTINDAMKWYCQSDGVCLRKILLEYFGFRNVVQKNCCCVCNGFDYNASQTVAVKIPVNQTKVRTLSVADVPVLFKQLQQVLLECEKLLNDSKYIALYHHGVLPSASEIMESIEFILNEDDLLKHF